MRTNRVERVVFILSAILLAFMSGVAVPYFNWFPNSVVGRALDEAEHILSPPSFVVPRVYDWEGVRMPIPERVQPGLTLIAKHWKDFDWTTGLRLVDRQGRTVHSWRVDPDMVFPDSAFATVAGTDRRVAERALHGAYLFEDGDVIVNIDYVGTARLDACGRVLWSLPKRGHHSIDRAADGTFWIAGVSREPHVGSPGHPDGLPGLDAPVYHDRILQISEDGRVLRRIDILDLLYVNNLQRHLVKTRRLQGNTDPTHLNDVEVLDSIMAAEFPTFEAGDLLVSLHGLDLVFVFEPETKKIKWHASHPFIEQHDPDFIAAGWIGVFDNNKDETRRGTMLGGSRIVTVQPHSDSVEVLFPTERSEPFYSDLMGKWQVLENGNLLLTESQAGRIVEVAPDGRTVWEWVGGQYEDNLIAEVSEGSRYDLTVEDVAAWPCFQPESSEYTNESDLREGPE